MINQAVGEVEVGLFTISPAINVGPDPGTVVPVVDGVVLDEAGVFEQPATSANRRRNRITSENFLMDSCIYIHESRHYKSFYPVEVRGWHMPATVPKFDFSISVKNPVK
jgi:hypothetical protein